MTPSNIQSTTYMMQGFYLLMDFLTALHFYHCTYDPSPLVSVIWKINRFIQESNNIQAINYIYQTHHSKGNKQCVLQFCNRFAQQIAQS